MLVPSLRWSNARVVLVKNPLHIRAIQGPLKSHNSADFESRKSSTISGLRSTRQPSNTEACTRRIANNNGRQAVHNTLVSPLDKTQTQSTRLTSTLLATPRLDLKKVIHIRDTAKTHARIRWAVAHIPSKISLLSAPWKKDKVYFFLPSLPERYLARGNSVRDPKNKFRTSSGFFLTAMRPWPSRKETLKRRFSAHSAARTLPQTQSFVFAVASSQIRSKKALLAAKLLRCSRYDPKTREANLRTKQSAAAEYGKAKEREGSRAKLRKRWDKDPIYRDSLRYEGRTLGSTPTLNTNAQSQNAKHFLSGWRIANVGMSSRVGGVQTEPRKLVSLSAEKGTISRWEKPHLKFGTTKRDIGRKRRQSANLLRRGFDKTAQFLFHHLVME